MAVVIIVVGVDDSQRSAIAARKASRLAVWLDADLHAVHVAHIPAAMLAVLAGVPAGTSEFTDAQRAGVWDVVGPTLDAGGARVTRVELEGYPADALVEYATDVDAGLVVVGSRGRGDLAALVLGSTSHRVVNQASCDVLVAKGD
ncbi:MAG: universal stress protein [Actinobacteria bacterium]|nr:universal stress protein [Actinomycetota bacterium]